MKVHLNRWAALRPVVAGVLAGVSMGSAQAFDDVLGPLAPLDSVFEVGVAYPNPLFVDTLYFSLTAPVVGDFSVKGQGLTIPGLFTLPPASSVVFALFKGGVPLTGIDTAFTGLNLLAGNDYSFKVAGTTGGYHVTWCLTPTVPEPETLALALAGVLVVGATARRRLS